MIDATVIARLSRVCYAVWEQIGSDCVTCGIECGEPVDNESALEAALDADRPAMFVSAEENSFVRDVFDKHGYSQVMRALRKHVHLV